jgi:hypothetical protein
LIALQIIGLIVLEIYQNSKEEMVAKFFNLLFGDLSKNPKN